MKIHNPAERLVHITIVYTWAFYAIGALFVVGPVLGWMLGMLAVISLYLGPAMRSDLRGTSQVPLAVWVWGAGMVVLLFALWAGHMDWDLGLKKMIKSSIGWAKGWALLFLFIFAGAVLPIKREVIIRAQCQLGAMTLLLAPILFLAPYLGMPEQIFTSPFRLIGGPGPEYFSVYFFTYDPASMTPRWQFYAPWSPFAAILGIVMILFALEERNRRWMLAGCLAGVLMILASKSRMGLVGLVICTISPRLMPLLLRGWAWGALAAISTSVAIWGQSFAQSAQDTVTLFKSARADSTRVRETLQNIAHERWLNDAFWFGHGNVRPGAHIVEYMPIGSHHTWYGLLFVKGLVGFLGLLVPFVWHIAIVLFDAVHHVRARLPLGIMLTLILLSFGENIEIEAYLLWPALVILGVHLREMKQSDAQR